MCLKTVLSQVTNAFNLLAPVCGSWSVVSRGSTYRSFANPMGHQDYQAVSFGNRMVSRFFGCSLCYGDSSSYAPRFQVCTWKRITISWDEMAIWFRETLPLHQTEIKGNEGLQTTIESNYSHQYGLDLKRYR